MALSSRAWWVFLLFYFKGKVYVTKKCVKKTNVKQELTHISPPMRVFLHFFPQPFNRTAESTGTFESFYVCLGLFLSRATFDARLQLLFSYSKTFNTESLSHWWFSRTFFHKLACSLLRIRSLTHSFLHVLYALVPALYHSFTHSRTKSQFLYTTTSNNQGYEERCRIP